MKKIMKKTALGFVAAMTFVLCGAAVYAQGPGPQGRPGYPSGMKSGPTAYHQMTPGRAPAPSFYNARPDYRNEYRPAPSYYAGGYRPMPPHGGYGAPGARPMPAPPAPEPAPIYRGQTQTSLFYSSPRFSFGISL